ncbi:inorganic phosphate transporter [Suhomyces tanzawaensis NRRL Y-17324]|uniref:Inorganic phosphate transporter n=1 Tax=Suhomyces tanzawaensis NRRL Y-17324 TaxID=984487 RepID=A0A1E4SS04_9ASCO|nr:inorganic phosphate transporter [Suhomyces tanzawaensis NRRL Y-17324]ODV82293.1 inorganic phosphate transporter [Suhomyces tanzawaensis NRRL Y-17324]
MGDDMILREKMKLINDAIDEIGFTWYHLKLFFLNGMGYATDTQLNFIESLVRTFVNYQFGYRFAVSNEAYAGGMILGGLFWGFSADLVGRKLAFNASLFLSAIFTILTGAMGNFPTYCLFVLLSSFAAGGNLVLDTCVFLEFLPHNYQWLLTLFAFFWGIGQTIAVALAYAFLPNNSCEGYGDCPSHKNMGWRYVYFTNGCIVLALAVLRVTVVRLKETPKFLVANNRDAEAVQILHDIASKYGRQCSLTLAQLEACGTIASNEDYRQSVNVRGTLRLMGQHLKILFSSKKMTRSTVLLFVSWLCLGIAYPLYSSFLPVYLATRGANISADTTAGVYRDNLISNSASTAGPIIAGLLLYYVPRLGRRGVLAIGGLSTMAFLFGYTAIRNRAQNVALSSLVYVTLYIYYGVIYAYTPEVMPSAARATGNCLCIVCTRITTAMVPIIAWYSDTSSLVPIWICGAFVGIIGLIALALPFEPSKSRVV